MSNAIAGLLGDTVDAGADESRLGFAAASIVEVIRSAEVPARSPSPSASARAVASPTS